MEAGGGAFNLGVASSPQEGRRKKTRRAGKKRKDARHRKVAQERGMTGERRGFGVGEVLHALVFQLSVADVSLLPLAELGDKPKLHDDGLGDLALQERRAHWMTEPYLCASLPIRPGLQCRCRCCTEDRDGWSQPCPRALCVAVSDQDRCGMCRRCIGGCSMRAGKSLPAAGDRWRTNSSIASKTRRITSACSLRRRSSWRLETGRCRR